MGLAGMAPQGMAPVQGQVTGTSYPTYCSSRPPCLSWAMYRPANRVRDLDNPAREHSVGLLQSCMITSASWTMMSSSKHLCARVKFHGLMTGSLWRLHSTQICLSNGMQQGCK